MRYRVKGGVSTYIENVLHALTSYERRYAIVLLKYDDQYFSFETKCKEIISIPYTSDVRDLFWTTFVLPKKLKEKKICLYHGMKWVGPYFNSVPTVFTLNSIMHDFEGRFPLPFKIRLLATFYQLPTFKRVVRFIVGSEYLRRYLTQRCSVDHRKIVLAYNGAEDSFSSADLPEDPRILQKLSLLGAYILCVGNINPVKNHLTAVRAFARISRGNEYRLAFAGSANSEYAQALRAEVFSLSLSERVVFLGFIDTPELACVMRHARLMVFPSLTESCSLSIIEAFSCGLPVVASCVGGIEEIVHYGGVCVQDPLNVTAFAKEIEKILISDALREQYSVGALAAAKKFSWQTTARIHDDVYMALLHES